MKRISWDEIELGQIMGTGTVGTVYRSRLKKSGQELAVKILQPAISTDELVRARFRREMQILQRLEHPHIIRYYGGGEHDGQLFFAMELLRGGNARDLLERYGSLAWHEVASIGRQVCSALQHVHNYGIIHRDLKPGNLFFDDQAQVKLGDFGIARDTQAADITSHGLTVGTHAYMSPEQITGADLINGKADLYSLGCVLFELLTGNKPFRGTNFAILFEQHLHQPAAKVTEYVADCPTALADVIDQLLQKDPDARPFNARSVQGVLLELLTSRGGTPASEGPETTDEPIASPMDVGAASVTDPGIKSLRRKIQPEARPSTAWQTLCLLCLLILAIISVAAIAAR